jgi:diguanylate cyclase (GGDEF)-like protein/PAS domain S-box-containing protein
MHDMQHEPHNNADRPSLYRHAFEHAVDGMVITDHETRILHVNHAFSRITGYSPDEALGQTPRLLKSGRHPASFYAAMWQAIKKDGHWTGEIWNKKKDGTIYLENLTIRTIHDALDNAVTYLACFKDITTVREKETQILFMAYHDALTSLPNRLLLDHRLDKAISRARRDKSKLALFFLDLDNFKRINDTLGHDKGDELLLEVTRRMNQAIRHEDILCRQGGDEFILLAENIRDDADIHLLAKRIFDVLRPPVVIGARPIQVQASVGVAIFPDDGETPTELTKNADMAMYRAKAEGKNKYVMFRAEMNRAMQAKLQLENDIRLGLAQKQFSLYFQPKQRCSDGLITSLEALLRWRHPDGDISPEQFIPVAEECGLMEELSITVIDQTCRFLRRLHDNNLLLPIAVNLSPRQFRQRNLIEILDRVLPDHDMDPIYLEFEVTESTTMTRVDETLDIMDRLRQRGFRFALDDFGTGHSSLGQLKRLPVSSLKIDKMFVDDLENNDPILVETIIAMGRKLGLKVVAEGVETLTQSTMLRAMGCDEMQGFLFSHPLSENETLDFLARRQTHG